MRGRIALLSVLAAVVILWASPAAALVLGTDAWIREYNPWGSPPVLELQDGPKTAASGGLLSSVSVGYEYFGAAVGAGGTPQPAQGIMALARGAAHELGVVAAEAEYFGVSGTVAETQGEASWSETFTNTSGGPMAYELQFLIPQGVLEMYDGAGLSYPPAFPESMVASYAIEIQLDGSPVWASGAELLGGSGAHVLSQTGTDIGSSYFEATTAPYFGYLFGPYLGTLDLGILGPGASFSLGYHMTTYAAGPGYETSARAAFGDPLRVQNDPTMGLQGEVTGTPAGPGIIPEPCSAILLLGGLAGAAALRRRKRA